MDNCEALLIKRTAYKESDLIVTFLTKEIGKFSGVARNAKKSKKRFGGRLEPFLHLKLDIRLNEKKFNSVNDVTLIKAYSGIMENLESFMIGSFVLEFIDTVSQECESSEQLFQVTLNTFDQLNKQKMLLPALLNFQLKALEISGYKPNLDFDELSSNTVGFSISKGVIVESKTADNKDIFDFHIDILDKPELMEIFLAKVANNIKVLKNYTEYHTGKQFKTSKFLEELNL